MVFIEDGKGTGNKAQVCGENHLQTDAITSTVEHHVNHEHGESYNFIYRDTPLASGDCIVYMKNLSNETIILEGMNIASHGDNIFDVVIGDTGTPVGVDKYTSKS